MVNKMYLFSFLFLVFNLSCSYIPPQNPDFFSESQIQSLLKQGGVGLGMTKAQVRQSWGEPKKIKKVNSKYYDEIWFYPFNWKGDSALYFKDGILID